LCADRALRLNVITEQLRLLLLEVVVHEVNVQRLHSEEQLIQQRQPQRRVEARRRRELRLFGKCGVDLHAGDLDTTTRFYRDEIGFVEKQCSSRWASLSFLLAARFLHRMALNTWRGVGASQPKPTTGSLHDGVNRSRCATVHNHRHESPFCRLFWQTFGPRDWATAEGQMPSKTT
jgi:catechol-2,3-dioxygenase